MCGITTQPPGGRLSTLRSPHVLAFSSNLFGSITHRVGRDTRVPVRAAARQIEKQTLLQNFVLERISIF
ncbi:MAG: hypothetical protein LBQ66_03595 [Planctomycetaceae bacterium]|nr:hypothetical protein [Planctomycetaceae bacterium]